MVASAPYLTKPMCCCSAVANNNTSAHSEPIFHVSHTFLSSMGNCYGYSVRRNKVMENTHTNGSGRKLMQLQEYGDGGVNRDRPIPPSIGSHRREGHRSSVQAFTEHNIESVHDLNLQRPLHFDLGLQNKEGNFNHLNPSQGGEVRRIKVLISSRELSELLRRNNGNGDEDMKSFLLQKLQGNEIGVRRSRRSWKPSLSRIPEVISPSV